MFIDLSIGWFDVNNFTCYIYLLWSTELRGLLVPKNIIKVGIQQRKINSQ